MDAILSGLLYINDTDVWRQYGVFLTEEQPGGLDNLTSIMMPSDTKDHTGVDIRENNGVMYPDELDVANKERNFTLTFALYAPTKASWMSRYASFIAFLKQGTNGWLSIRLPELNNLTMRVFFLKAGNILH